MMLSDFLNVHFITLFLILGFSMKLAMRKSTRDAEIRYLWMTVGCVVVLMFADFLEVVMSQDPDKRFWRILFSVIGYSVRPMAALGIVLVVADRKKKKWLLWIPAIVNGLLMCTAFFSPVAFCFNEEYSFRRGPLGYVVFAVGFLYIIMVLWFTTKRFNEDHPWEKRVLYLCALFVVLATFADALWGGEHLNEAIMIVVVFYYMFIRSQDTNRDALTKLLNRQSFYEDSELYQPQVSAVASLDMNGLKRLNDSQGHDAGDRALSAIGECMLASAGRTVIPYRMGGDEFAILFLRENEYVVQAVLQQIQTKVKDAGLGLSVGYAVRTQNETINELHQLADQKMYVEKSAYYSLPGRNRRRRSD